MNITDVLSSLPVLESLTRALINQGCRGWYALCLALPAFGRYSLNKRVQRAVRDVSVRTIYITGGGRKTVLPNGMLHSVDDKPAQVGAVCSKSWWKLGKRHRDNDLPAVYRADGEKEWWINGLKHRENDLPAVIFGRSRQWWKNGKLHRDNGQPAIIRPQWGRNIVMPVGSSLSDFDYKEWWVEGKRVK